MNSPLVQAVIEIGSTGIRLLVAESALSKKSRKQFTVLDTSENRVSIGHDVFTQGSISRESLLACLHILELYREQITGYGLQPDQVQVIATSAVREAKNRDPFVDRIKVKTGFNVRVIDGIEENRLMYISMSIFCLTKSDICAIITLNNYMPKGARTVMLHPGLYEQFISRALNEQLAASPDKLSQTAKIDEAEASKVLAKYIAGIIEKGLDTVRDNGGDLMSQVELANRIVSEAKRRGMYKGPPLGGPLLVLAGLATVTDIMPLLGQNRILVAEALKRFFTCAPIGLRELHARAARAGTTELTTRDFSFMLGPRINAAGRVIDFGAAQALELVISEDQEIVRELARLVDGYNLERKQIEQRMTDEALAKVVPGAPAQVIDLSDGHPGVAGIVAARVMERLDRDVPVCVYAGGHGSARAPDGFNIRDAFVACDEVLERYGGHAAAGGFGVKEGRLDDFRRMLCDYCERVSAAETDSGEKKGRGEPDLWVEPADLTLELAEELRQLEPFGEGNREPVFGLKGVWFSEVKATGMDGKHLAVTLRGSGLKAMWWSHGDLVEKLRSESAAPHDITFTLAISDYGERHAELRLVSITAIDIVHTI